MKDSLVSRLQTFFKRRDWDPNAIHGLGVWELSTSEYGSAVAGTEGRRGMPHPQLLLSDRLKKVQAELEALEESLPDLNGLRS